MSPLHAPNRPMRSVHVFWNMSEYWTEENGKHLLTIPPEYQDDAFIVMLQKLSRVGHQIYFTIFSGVADLHESLDQETLARWEKAISRLVEAGAACGVLVDRGSGFWQEHTVLGQEG